MKELINIVNTKYKEFDINKLDYNKPYFIVSPKDDLEGIILENETIMLKYKEMFSFKMPTGNICNLRQWIILYNKDINDITYFRNYFYDNNCNPYAIAMLFKYLRYNVKELTNLTQFPPLNFKKTKEEQSNAMDLVIQKAEPSDLIFVYDRKSGISKYIRKIDRCMWSHCGGINMNKEIIEMTTAGIRRGSFEEYRNENIDLGLYRLKQQISFESKEKMHDFSEDKLRKQTRYNWKGVVKLYLKKKFKIPIDAGPSPADIIYGNKLQLIAYA